MVSIQVILLRKHWQTTAASCMYLGQLSKSGVVLLFYDKANTNILYELLSTDDTSMQNMCSLPHAEHPPYVCCFFCSVLLQAVFCCHLVKNISLASQFVTFTFIFCCLFTSIPILSMICLEVRIFRPFHQDLKKNNNFCVLSKVQTKLNQTAH